MPRRVRMAAVDGDLFNREALDYESFRKTVLRHFPGAEDDLRPWLETSEFPPRFRRDPP